ncbi:MAG TPA: DUF2281 domain-containing protein [Ignavibacteria bacterium]|nr:DUF2281 domain-containing protein [Ignavibacteria bacterium]
MNSELLLKKLESLSKNEKREVLDFIDFLKSKKNRFPERRQNVKVNLENEKFIGMWKNRTEMKDSTSWVRNLRKSEWVD